MSSVTENKKMKLYIVNAPLFNAIAVGDKDEPDLTIIAHTVNSGQWDIVRGAKSDPGFEESSIGERLKNEKYYEMCEVDSSATEKIVECLKKIRNSGQIVCLGSKKFGYIIEKFWYTIMDDCGIDGKKRFGAVLDQLRLGWEEDQLEVNIPASESRTEKLKKRLEVVRAKRAAYFAELV